MPVLIDGNNLLHAAQDAEDPERLIGRARLCRELGRWAQRCRQRVHVVFDGCAPNRQLASQIGDPDVQVSYSGSGVSADAVLIEVLEGDSAARRFSVVSSDRQIVRAARRRRAQTVASDVFWTQVKRDLAKPPPIRLEPSEKSAGLQPEATEQWLRELGLNEAD